MDSEKLASPCWSPVGLPLGLIGRLDRVLRSAARLIGHTPKYASVSSYVRDGMHLFHFSQRILYRISALVSGLASRRALRSSARGELLVPRARSALKQRKAVSVIGPSTWNQLPLTLRLLPRNC